MKNLAAPLCAVCGSRAATHVCQTCGRPVCKNCIDPVQWSCTECRAKVGDDAPQEKLASQSSLGMWLLFVAFAVIFIGMLLMAFGSLSSLGNASGGVIILIGPIPIIIGSGPYSLALVALASVLTICALAFFLLIRRRH